jgi:hypothetical protein
LFSLCDPLALPLALLAGPGDDSTDGASITACRQLYLPPHLCQTKPAVVTGAASRQGVWNFPLPREDGASYEDAAAQRGTELLGILSALEEAAGGQPRQRSAHAASTAASVGTPTEAADEAVATLRNGNVAVAVSRSDGSCPAATAGASTAINEGAAGAAAAAAPAQQCAPGQLAGGGKGKGPMQKELAEALAAGRAVETKALLYHDLEVTTPVRKRVQAQFFLRIARDIKQR